MCVCGGPFSQCGILMAGFPHTKTHTQARLPGWRFIVTLTCKAIIKFLYRGKRLGTLKQESQTYWISHNPVKNLTSRHLIFVDNVKIYSILVPRLTVFNINLWKQKIWFCLAKTDILLISPCIIFHLNFIKYSNTKLMYCIYSKTSS